MAHTFTNILLHLIFSTKDRVPWMQGDLKPRLLAYIGGIAQEMHAIAVSIDGTADHVHMLVVQPANVSVSDLARTVKTNSSKWVHEHWPEQKEFAWQTGYGAFSVSLSAAEDVKRYIARQEEHHKKVSFQEEFVAFLKRHGISYDERYIWE